MSERSGTADRFGTAAAMAALVAMAAASGAAAAHEVPEWTGPAAAAQTRPVVWASAYNAMPPEAGTTMALAPLLRSRHTSRQMTTGVAVQNAGAEDAVVMLTARDAEGNKTSGLPGMTRSGIAPGATAWFWPPDFLRMGNWAIAANAYGSGEIVSNQPLLVTVQDVAMGGSVDAALYLGAPVDAPGPVAPEHAVPAMALRGADGAATGLLATNLDPVETAQMSLEAWPPGGGPPVVAHAPPVPPLQGANFYAPATLFAPGEHSAIVTSDRAASIQARTDWTTDGGAVLHDEVPLGDDIVVPLVARTVGAVCSVLAIQNVEPDREASVTIGLQPLDGGAPLALAPRVIAPRRSAVLAMCDDPQLADLADGFEGSARIRSDGAALAVTADLRFHGAAAVHGFEGQPARGARPKLMAPLVHAGATYAGGLPELSSRIVVHNPGQAPVRITVEYQGFDGTCAGQRMTQGPIEVAPGASSIIQVSGPTAVLPDGCSASAVLTSDGEGFLAAVLDEGLGEAPSPTPERATGSPTTTATQVPATATATATEAPSRAPAYVPYCEKPAAP